MAITETPYNTRKWRDLPRNGPCAVGDLLGMECLGPISLHHVHPLSAGGAAFGKTIMCCPRHHPMLEALARRAWGEPEYKRCPHKPGTHRYPGAREACERQLNARLGS